jgi:hypothetical protein
MLVFACLLVVSDSLSGQSIQSLFPNIHSVSRLGISIVIKTRDKVYGTLEASVSVASQCSCATRSWTRRDGPAGLWLLISIATDRPTWLFPIGTNDTVGLGLGNKTGNFFLSGVFFGGAGPVSAVTADFDQNGTADLAMAAFNQIAVSLLLGTGDGYFSGPVLFEPWRLPA